MLEEDRIMSKYRCKVCGYVHEGPTPPAVCPVCGAAASEFELVENGEPKAQKRQFLGGKNSNVYILFYSAVMVIIVAALLAVTSLSLKSRQNANVLNEKKNAITSALGLPIGSYDATIEAYTVNDKGEKIEADEEPLQMLFDLKEAFAKGYFPVFEDKNTGETVVPVTGKGLWGDIWGYIAMKSDMNTVKGVIFDHEGETPGLGAEIATPRFWKEFEGQTVYEGDEFVSIAVVKGGAKGAPHAVDAVTGGTKTSLGLQNMLHDCLGYYNAFFESRRAAAAAPDTVQKDETTENVENHE